MSQQSIDEALHMVLSFINRTVDDVVLQLQPLIETASDMASDLASGQVINSHSQSTSSAKLPARITIEDIEKELDPRHKYDLIEKYGATRYWKKVGAKPIHKDRFGTIYRHVSDGEYQFFVRVVNSTREPDGSRKEYFIQVPPYMVSAREAVAWTFGMEARDYGPAVET